MKIGFPFNRYERWTMALKLMLTDLKTCLAWVVNSEDDGGGGGGGRRERGGEEGGRA